MLKINKNYAELKTNYLFSEIARKVAEYSKQHPEKEIIRMGIGDVTRPLCEEVVEGLKSAAESMGVAETFKGYGPEQGYDFLRDAVRDYYTEKGVTLQSDEIFISDGAKSDIGNILDLFDKDNTVLVPDPVYPVYVDTNIMDGRKIVYLKANEENGFLPLPDISLKGDIIYMCSPNNPTGAVYDRKGLKKWVDFALQNKAIILFDAAYEAFVSDENLPRSIYEVDGAKKCAIEFSSLSKTAGFTGTRCGYTVVPHELDFDGDINHMWLRRQTTKFNGVSYVVQCGAEKVFGHVGRKQIAENINAYRKNAKIITDTLDSLGIYYTGGKHSPYIWLKCPNEMKSWEFFDFLLEKAGIVGTPGAGFGENGEGFFRLTAFSTEENTKKAMERLKTVLKEL